MGEKSVWTEKIGEISCGEEKTPKKAYSGS